MKKIVVTILLVFITYWIYLLLTSNPTKSEYIKVYPTSKPPYVLNEQKLWSLIQDWRVSQNLQTYIEDQRLCDVAEIRLQEIKTDWSHNGFWKHNETIPYTEAGENLAKDNNSEQSTLDSWLNSASHEANLRKNYTHSCIETEGLYAIQLFANY